MKHLAVVTLMGKDRQGVIAMTTQYLLSTRANIESLEEQVARGRFRMTLQASWETADFKESEIQKGLRVVTDRLKMNLTWHATPLQSRQRMAILVTKEDHVLKALLAAANQNRVKAEPVVIISNRADLGQIAARAGLPFHHIPYNDRALAEEQIIAVLDKYRVGFVVLARFMKILSPDFVWRWKNRIINIHPSLLPAFPGASAYRQAYEKGVKIAGVTAHFVTPDLDQGPIIWQEAFRVQSDDKLSDLVRRGQLLESRCLVRAVQLFIRQRLDVHWGKVYS